MFIFPLGFYTAHFLYLFCCHSWVTFLSTELNLSLLQILWVCGLVPSSDRRTDGISLTVMICVMLALRPEGVHELAEVVASLGPAPFVPKYLAQLQASSTPVCLVHGPLQTSYTVRPSPRQQMSLAPVYGSDLTSTSQDTTFLALFI